MGWVDLLQSAALVALGASLTFIAEFVRARRDAANRREERAELAQERRRTEAALHVTALFADLDALSELTAVRLNTEEPSAALAGNRDRLVSMRRSASLVPDPVIRDSMSRGVRALLLLELRVMSPAEALLVGLKKVALLNALRDILAAYQRGDSPAEVDMQVIADNIS